VTPRRTVFISSLLGLSVLSLAALALMEGLAFPSTAGAATHRGTTPVERRDLVERENVDGTLGYGSTTDVASPRAGTLTRVPAAGSVVERGQSIFDVDALPVPLLYGELPLYRDLALGVSNGADVQQLEENLVALGYGDSLTVDEHFDSATATALRAWQADLGVERTGALTRSGAVISSGPIRIAEVKARKGASVGPGQPVVSTTGTTRLVTVRLDVARQSLATVGAPARIVLPGNKEVGGRIVDVGTVATRDNNQGSAKINVTVGLDNDADAGNYSEAPVQVRLTKDTTSDALVVPVRALLALSEGGYAVETVRNGVHKLVGVELGAFADGFVEITGRVQPGTKVVVPS
jgi:peptidoglycan hydrolase-like protein with peptidoglycan-binding domain